MIKKKMSNITNGTVYDWYISGGKGLSVKEAYKKFELADYQQSETRLYSKLKALEKKINELKSKKSKTAAATLDEYLSKVFNTVSEIKR